MTRVLDHNPQRPIPAILDRLAELRRRNRWSQDVIAAHLDLTLDAYRSLEKGRTTRLEWETLLRLLDILDRSELSVDWFFGRTPRIAAGVEREDQDDFASVSSNATLAPTPIPIEQLYDAAPRPPLPTPVYRVPRLRHKRGFRSRSAGLPVLDLGQFARALQHDGSVIPAQGTARLKLAPDPGPDAIGVRAWGNSLPSGYQDGVVLVCRKGPPAAGNPGLLVTKSKEGRECLLAVWRTEPSGQLRVTPLDSDLPARLVAPGDVLAEFMVVRRIPRVDFTSSAPR